MMNLSNAVSDDIDIGLYYFLTELNIGNVTENSKSISLIDPLKTGGQTIKVTYKEWVERFSQWVEIYIDPLINDGNRKNLQLWGNHSSEEVYMICYNLIENFLVDYLVFRQGLYNLL